MAQGLATTIRRLPPMPPMPPMPAIGGLRHSAIVHPVLAWYRDDRDVACTQRYLRLIPELLDQASRAPDWRKRRGQNKTHCGDSTDRGGIAKHGAGA